jgi:hypothetical protein
MLNTEERRFLRNWEEQRKDGKTQYFLLYIIAGTIVMTIGVFFVASMFTFGRPKHLWPIPLISTILMTTYTWLSWKKNEKRWKSLIKRELDENKG